MFLVVNGDGRFWDGVGWNVKGKVFCTIGRATRSLYEEGESAEEAEILPLDELKTTPELTTQ